MSQSFTLYEGTTPIDGVVSYSGVKASFNPTSNLTSSTTYTAKITTAAKNVEGTPMENDYSWTFTTVAPLGPLGVDLGSAGNFAILAGAGVTNTGASTQITGNVGSFPTATIVGLLPGNVTGILYTTASPIVERQKVI